MNNRSNDFNDGFEGTADAFERDDYETAYKLFSPLAEQGDARAQCNLGLMYHEGQGVPEDNKEAIKWWRLSAEQRNEQAQVNLATMHDDGIDYLISSN